MTSMDESEISTVSDHQGDADGIIVDDIIPGDVRHHHPTDNHTVHIWLYEQRISSDHPGVLTQDGITQIAYHKYQPGHYTTFDTICNPLWTNLTELLPMWVAPNMVTTIGGIHCVVAYIVTWIYGTTNFYETDVVPRWIYIMNGYCLFMYYTFDCMDGKQARRTSSSSPLGQLFDHGMDCICLQHHISMVMSFLLFNGPWLLSAQAALQIGFFVAQLEEYYTGQLPHATGNIGVTEINYGLSIISIVNGILLPRNSQDVYGISLSKLPILSSILPVSYQTYQLKHILFGGWISLVLLLIVLSMIRIVRHIGHHRQRQFTVTVQLSAISKLLSPILISIIGPLVLLPVSVQYNETRYISITIGMAVTVITIKLIVFSMAKQAYAVVQYPECCIILAICYWIRNDTKITSEGIHLLWQITATFFLIRTIRWGQIASLQICHRLKINVFTIPYNRSTNSSNDKKQN